MRSRRRSIVFLVLALACAPDQFVSMGSDARGQSSTVPGEPSGGAPASASTTSTSAGAMSSTAGTPSVNEGGHGNANAGTVSGVPGTGAVGFGGSSATEGTELLEVRAPL